MHLAQDRRKAREKQLIGLLGLGAKRFGDRLVKYLTKALALNLDKTGHLPPGMRCRGLESPASRKSSCHVAGCRGMDKSFLKFLSLRIFLYLPLITSEIVEPFTFAFSSFLFEAVRIVTTRLGKPLTKER